eukprot:11405580-Alexandrium_andersonii.AAC.1
MIAQGYDAGYDSPYFPPASLPITQLNNSARPFGELRGFARNTDAYVSSHPSANDLSRALRDIMT